ncbi:cell wall hydrolase [Clostridium sp.]|uniref:cell wall hydrolase n=1 Tax=Clostridium sp. TaxID=1506 RepID=UPI002623DB1F|nr:cell wall hydrolase [Clostridium sp.]
MRKNINNYYLFFFAFALFLIININAKEILATSHSNEHVTKNDYIGLVQLATNPNEATHSALNLNTADEVVAVFKNSSCTIPLTKDDIYLMSQVVYAESKGEPFDGKVAVASVILNRATDSHFPNTVEGVVTQKNAFSCVRDGKINTVPDNDSYDAVIKAIEGNDPTNEALYFYNPKISTCSWMKNIEKTGIKSIGQHVFFNVN